eukprot:g24645.t1
MLPVGENSKGFGSSLRCPQSEENVLHWFKDVLSATILAEGEQEEGRSFGKLKAVGRGEEELCQRGEVTTFDELKLGFGYGEFLAKNAEEIGSLLDRFDDTDASSPLTRDLRTFCDELKALQCNASEALCGIRGHFASLLSPAQAQVAWNRASGLTNAAASPVLDKIQKTADAVEEIASAPFLMDLQVVLDWEDQFQPVLGELSSFLSSSDFATQWNRRGRRRDADDPGQITLLGWRHFVRLPSGSVEDFAKALDRKDPAAASGAVLHRYLAEGRNFRQDQRMEVLRCEPEQRVPPLPRRDHGHHGRHGAAAAPSRGAAQLEMSDVDSSDGVISEGTDEDEGPRRDDGQTVQGAVKRLADDLYSGEVHFMLELLQNADDCDFPSDALPSLTVTFESNPEQFAKWTTFEPSKPASAYLIIEHNETGFRDFNLKALCDIAQSTKAGGASALGSGLQSSQRHECRSREDLKPELLLFLRKLEKITIVDHVLNVKKTIQKFIDEPGREVRLDTSTVSTAPDNLKEDGDQGWGA